jgi:hypothetical protein
VVTDCPPKGQIRWFVLQGWDAILQCPVIEARFQVRELSLLFDILGNEARDDIDLCNSYPLADNQLSTIEERFGAKLAAAEGPVFLTPWHSTRDAPYLNHAGFELALMLEGRKPFAKFSDRYPSEWLDQIIASFEPFVVEGRIVQRLVKRPSPTLQNPSQESVRKQFWEVYFALPGQEWRIDANLLLFEIGCQAGWNEALERFEGALLGYEKWQNDWHLERLRREGRSARWNQPAIRKPPS